MAAATLAHFLKIDLKLEHFHAIFTLVQVVGILNARITNFLFAFRYSQTMQNSQNRTQVKIQNKCSKKSMEV